MPAAVAVMFDVMFAVMVKQHQHLPLVLSRLHLLCTVLRHPVASDRIKRGFAAIETLRV